MSTVLTVDDSKVVRSMVSRHLQPYGCTIVEATNGREGVAMARTHRPDLVLLDVTMPEMDGRQALSALRQDDATKRIPVIMLTAETGHDVETEIAKLGADGCIVKPFQHATFEKEVSKVLGAPGAAAGAPAGATGVDPRTVPIANTSATPDDVLKEYVSEDGGCPVFTLSSQSSKVLLTLLPIFGKKLRALAEHGNDKLIVDVGQLNELTSAHVAGLARLLSEAGTLGIRTAICAPDALVTQLRQIAQTKDASYASTRDAARQRLQ